MACLKELILSSFKYNDSRSCHTSWLCWSGDYEQNSYDNVAGIWRVLRVMAVWRSDKDLLEMVVLVEKLIASM
jgi:hypothetical protein